MGRSHEAMERWARSDEDLIVERDGSGVVTAVLNRPATYNAITEPMFDALGDLFAEVAERPDDRVLLLTSVGDVFSSGGDISGKGGRGRHHLSADDIVDPHARAVAKGLGMSRPALLLHELAKPTIAAVPGLATGAGCSFAMGCDLVLGTESSRFSLVFVRRAMGLDMGATWLLPRLVGLQQARYLALTGEWLRAEDAARLGLVLEVHPDKTALLDRAFELAEQLSALSPIATSSIKVGLARSGGMSFREAIEYECDAQATCTRSDEYRAAIAAFRERRRPAR